MRHQKLLLFVLATVMMTTGCKIGTNYRQPNVDLGKNYRFASAMDSISFGDTSWRYVYQDPVLQNLIKKGISNNFDLKMAYERVNQARAAFKKARAEIWPVISVSGAATFNQQALPSGGTVNFNDYYATGNLSWEIDIWGKLRRAKESARAILLANEAFRQSIYISLIAEIASGYFNLLEYQDEYQITTFNVKIREEALELVLAKLIAGTVSGLVVAQAEAELAQVKTQIPAIQKAIGMQENALQFLVGALPGPVITGDSILKQIPMGPIPTAGLPSRLILRRPDIISAEQELISANAQIGVARGMMLPTLAISAGAGYSDLGAGFIGSAVGNLIAPIFGWGKLRQNVINAKSFKEEMLVNYQKTIYTGITEVSNGLLSVEKQQSIVAENKNLVAAAQTAFDLSNQLFTAGYASYLDVINAQRLLYQAQIYLSQSELNRLLAYVNLYLALGGGWR